MSSSNLVTPVLPANAVTARRKPGRPRDPAVQQAILRAARQILDEGGPSALTMEGLAVRAGVGKPTLYRWWPDRHAVAMAALMEPVSPATPTTQAAIRSSASALRMLQRQLVATAETFATRTGRNMAMLIAAADTQSELSKAFRHHFILTRREEGRQWLLQAQAAHELSAKADLNLLLDQIYGAVFFRLMLGHAPLDEAFVKRLLAQVLAGATSPKS